MRTALALNGLYVNTNRMVEQNACFPGPLLKQAPVEERVFAV
jgi:hypothetical protein